MSHLIAFLSGAVASILVLVLSAPVRVPPKTLDGEHTNPSHSRQFERPGGDFDESRYRVETPYSRFTRYRCVEAYVECTPEPEPEVESRSL